MLGVRQHLSNGGRIARELISDDYARLGAAFAVKHPVQEALCSHLIAAVLDQNVQYDAMLINGSPQPVAFAADLQRHLVNMPFVASAYSSSTQPCSECCAEFGAPLPDSLVADDDATLGEQILNVAETDVKAEVQPYGMSDDLGREAIASIGRPAASVTDIGRDLSPIPAQVDNTRRGRQRAAPRPDQP